MESLVESWQSLAFQTPDYISGKRYAAILGLLITTQSENECSLQLKGNQPLFSKQRLQDQDCELLFGALVRSEGARVTALDLSYNCLTDSSIQQLAKYIKSSHCTLETLNLAYNDFGAEGADILSTALQFNNTVSRLCLDGCKIGQRGGISVASMLQVNRSIRQLGLAATDLDTDSLIAISTVLLGNNTVSSIDLSKPLLHSTMEETTIHISKMLQVNVTLTELYLSKHGMSDTGAEWFCRMLQQNYSLKHLDISCNKLSRDGARHLSVLLGHNTPLSSLDLSYNRIEDEGLVHISTVLGTINKTLTSLSVCSNSIGDVGLCALADALSSNTTLTRIGLWGNKLGEPTCNAFRALLENDRLSPSYVDVMYYEVDGITYLARTDNK